MSLEILRLKVFAGLSFAAVIAIATGMTVGMLKSTDGQSKLAFFTGGIGGVITVISLWANPPSTQKQQDQVNLSSGGLQVNVSEPAAESFKQESEPEPRILR
jgi:hypothetical protein